MLSSIEVGCNRVLGCDAVEYWAGMLLSNELGCCLVSVEDTNLITEFGVGCCRVRFMPTLDAPDKALVDSRYLRFQI